MPRLRLRPHDAPDRTPADRLLVPEVADAPVIVEGAGGVDPDRVDPSCREVPGSSGHVVLDYAGPGAAEQALSPTRLRAIADRLDTAALVVCVPHPDRLLASSPHPVAVSMLGSLGGAAFEAVARTGGPTLSRRLYLVTEGRVASVFEPGTLAARRAVGVSARRPEAAAPASAQDPAGAPAPAGLFGWLRRLAGR